MNRLRLALKSMRALRRGGASHGAHDGHGAHSAASEAHHGSASAAAYEAQTPLLFGEPVRCALAQFIG